MNFDYSRKELLNILQQAFMAMCLTACSSVSAQNLAINSSVLSSGGGTLVSPDFELTGIVGQPFSGGAIGGNDVLLEAGFWLGTDGFITDELRVHAVLEGGFVIISWSLQATGYLLEEAENVSEPLNWTKVTEVVQNQVAITPSERTKIYRLRGSLFPD
jgi:hypothetical protein